MNKERLQQYLWKWNNEHLHDSPYYLWNYFYGEDKIKQDQYMKLRKSFLNSFQEGLKQKDFSKFRSGLKDKKMDFSKPSDFLPY